MPTDTAGVVRRGLRIARLWRELQSTGQGLPPAERERLIRTANRYRDVDVPEMPDWAREPRGYDPAWAQRFQAEAVRIRAALGSDLVDVQHVGSSAIPGLRSKPVLDVAVVSRGAPGGAVLVAQFEALGYRCHGASPVDAAATWFWSPPDPPAILVVHVCEPDNAWPARATTFRDYVIAHPEEGARYEQRKAALAALPETTFFEYCLGKLALNYEIDLRAAAWRKAQELP